VASRRKKLILLRRERMKLLRGLKGKTKAPQGSKRRERGFFSFRTSYSRGRG